jgi:hypothetical protein
VVPVRFQWKATFVRILKLILEYVFIGVIFFAALEIIPPIVKTMINGKDTKGTGDNDHDANTNVSSDVSPDVTGKTGKGETGTKKRRSVITWLLYGIYAILAVGVLTLGISFVLYERKRTHGNTPSLSELSIIPAARDESKWSKLKVELYKNVVERDGRISPELRADLYKIAAATRDESKWSELKAELSNIAVAAKDGSIWSERQMVGDGNCFFRALAYHKYKDEDEYEKIKKELLKAWEQDTGKSRYIKDDLGLVWDEIGKTLKNPREWGGANEARFAADYFNVKIDIRTGVGLEERYEYEPQDNFSETWTLRHTGGNHYNVLKKI